MDVKVLESMKNVQVTWINLKEVAEIGTGSNNTNEQVDNGEYPFYVRSKDVKRINNFSFDETAIIIPGEGGIGEIFHFAKGKYGLHQRAYRVHLIDSNINPKYIYYYMRSRFKRFIQRVAVSATVSSIRKPMIEKFQIPIPPLEVQNQIVEILDKFTDYVTELTTELTLREQQYAYYREKLLTFEDTDVSRITLGDIAHYSETRIPASEVDEQSDVKVLESMKNVQVTWINLKEVAEIGTGSNNTNEQVDNGEYPFYVRSKDVKRINNFSFDETAIIIPGEGGIGEIFHFAKGKYGLHQRAYRVHLIDSNINPKYIYYYMRSRFKRFIQRVAVSATVSSIRKPMIEKFQIPIPPLEVQNQIVEILDKFDTLTTSITEGLPREIELRQQQYEYYRDQLLAFDGE